MHAAMTALKSGSCPTSIKAAAARCSRTIPAQLLGAEAGGKALVHRKGVQETELPGDDLRRLLRADQRAGENGIQAEAKG